ncbi:MAG: DUF2330 domain-containing protein [Archangium sp.]|nr:DUF2330 domain-containing protein [Archangium sp.]
MLRALLILCSLGVALISRPADACGCFAPTTVVSPVVQAGERILFAVRDGKVIAHIQIQYVGDAQNFGWLLPLPSVPTMKAGSEELFERLLEETTPVYTTQGNVKCRPITFGCASFARTAGTSVEEDAGTGPVVSQGSVGPYEFAVLSAANKDEMLRWLNDNRFFIPTGTQSAVDPYINPGAYFLALKLQSGRTAGDIAPIVLEYESSYPMIPLVLTSVGATPNMGVQVWLLGNGRGIPRNYAHVVLNDAVLDWASGVPNYADVITRAVGEAPNKHAFVTEYAGPSAPLLLDETRFATENELAITTGPDAFISALKQRRFGRNGELPTPLVRVIATELPVPPALVAKGITEAEWVDRLGSYLGDYRDQNPDDFMGYTATFDAPRLAARVFADYVKPIRDGFALFAEFPKLTRLVTTLNPEDMTADPVFAFNASLPDVSHRHTGVQDFGCGTVTDITTEQGWMFKANADRSGLPAALSIANVPEEGQPVILTNNVNVVAKRFPLKEGSPLTSQVGCSASPLALFSLAAVFAFTRRRRVTSRAESA